MARQNTGKNPLCRHAVQLGDNRPQPVESVSLVKIQHAPLPQQTAN